MPQRDPYGFSIDNVFLEAEVAPDGQTNFETRYQETTGGTITPGIPPEYQEQQNKWGVECRIYFNSDATAEEVRSKGFHVEEARPYRDSYRYRINSVKLWWELVEDYSFRLGIN